MSLLVLYTWIEWEICLLFSRLLKYPLRNVLLENFLELLWGSSHQKMFFKKGVLDLSSKSVKNNHKVVHFLVKSKDVCKLAPPLKTYSFTGIFTYFEHKCRRVILQKYFLQNTWLNRAPPSGCSLYMVISL